MNVLLKKIRNSFIYEVYIDGDKSKYNIRKNGFQTDVYYLVYYGNQLKGRLDSMEEVLTFLRTRLLDTMADIILGGKK